MNQRGSVRYPPYDFDFSARCDECAGLCCVVPQIDAVSGLILKSANRVCEHLDFDTSGVAHACKIYETRRSNGYGVCREYSCCGAGNALTSHLRKTDGIFPNGTVSPDSVATFDLLVRIAWFLEVEIGRLKGASFFSSKKKRWFVRDCAEVYRRFLEESRLTLPDGTETDVASLREWYFENYRIRFATIAGIPVFSKFQDGEFGDHEAL